MRRIDLSKTNGTLKKHLEKALMRNNYKVAMVNAFNKHFESIKDARPAQVRESFFKFGKSCKYLTPKEYADLAVETYNEVMETNIKKP